jgi:predicted TIM-barrel fold metal-dependent hydrolase
MKNLTRALAFSLVAATTVLATTACSVARDQQTVGSYVDDAGITTAVKAKMAEDKNVSATSISVETLNGTVQLSGFAKFSQDGYPFADAQAHVMRLWQAFGPERCMWASDWPYLRATSRLDYGPMLKLTERWFSPQQCQQMMWDNPKRFFDW